MSSSPITVQSLDGRSAAACAAWDAFVAPHPEASIAHASGWGEVIRRTYGHRPHLLVARSDETLVGVLPLVEVRSRLFGSSLVSMPYLDVAGLLTTAPAARSELLRAAVDLAGSRRLRKLDLRSLARPAIAGPAAQEKVTLILELGTDEEALWKAIGSKPRNQVRKAQKSDLTARRTDAAGVEAFYRVYAANMRDLGSPPHKLDWFRQIFRVFGEAAGCHLVERQGETIGGLITLDLGDTVTVPWASSDRRFFKLCPNNLLYWDTFTAAIARGRTRFDFGRSSKGAGTYKFKRQWGAEETQLYWQELDPGRVDPAWIAGAAADTAPAVDESDTDTAAPAHGGGKRELAVKVWQRLPVGLATWLGSRLRGGITL